MGCNNVTQAGTFVRHIVPRKGKPAIFWSVAQEQIRYHPCAILKLTNVCRRILTIGTYQVAGQEVRRGEHHAVRVKTNDALALAVDGDDIDAIVSVRIIWNNLRRSESQPYLRFGLFVKMRNESAGAFWP